MKFEEITGYMVMKDGSPVEMCLNDDIVGGTSIQDPYPVFLDEDDAIVAFKNNAGLHCEDSAASIVRVSIQVVEVIKEVAYNDEDEEEE